MCIAISELADVETDNKIKNDKSIDLSEVLLERTIMLPYL